VEAWAERLGAIVLPTGSLRAWRPEPRSRFRSTGFDDGAWWVQDAAGPPMPARPLRGPFPARRRSIAAPRRAARPRSWRMPGASVTALDMSANRLKRLSANLDRLGAFRQLPYGRDRYVSPFAPDEFVSTPCFLDAPCFLDRETVRPPSGRAVSPSRLLISRKLADLQARMLDKTAEFVAPRRHDRLLQLFRSTRTRARPWRAALPASGRIFEIVPIRREEAPGGWRMRSRPDGFSCG
jgi:16S rRNA (cytosine967-C5)-methyltransferase